MACVVLARRFSAAGEPGWVRYSVATAVACLVLTAWPDLDSLSWRLALAVAVGWAWVSAIGVKWLQRHQR